MGIVQTDKAWVVEPYTTPALSAAGMNPGYKFVDWARSADGAGEHVPGNVQYRPSSDMTLYAQWKRNDVSVEITVYSWNDVYDVVLEELYYRTEQVAVTHEMTAQHNKKVLTLLGNKGRIRFTSPGFILQVPDDESFGGVSGREIINLDGGEGERVLEFTVGEFRHLYISKMPVGQDLALDGPFHDHTSNYGAGGTLFGGHRYAVHWYDDYTFTQNRTTSTPTSYVFEKEGSCFVNAAHKGQVTGHVMHIWLGYKNLQTGGISEFVNFEKTGMEISYPNRLKNFYTCYVEDGDLSSDPYASLSGNGEIVLDFSGRPSDERFLIGYSVTDAGAGCEGIKFRGKYRVYIVDDGCDAGCQEIDNKRLGT